mmetsp:Transcript_39484/g.102237  ORF Transcript_39484/g.102237 Transcript_39484/m.102237 type:complete len:314 (-) Transcript_39484:922-1863(-)
MPLPEAQHLPCAQAARVRRLRRCKVILARVQARQAAQRVGQVLAGGALLHERHRGAVHTLRLQVAPLLLRDARQDGQRLAHLAVLLPKHALAHLHHGAADGLGLLPPPLPPQQHAVVVHRGRPVRLVATARAALVDAERLEQRVLRARQVILRHAHVANVAQRGRNLGGVGRVGTLARRLADLQAAGEHVVGALEVALQLHQQAQVVQNLRRLLATGPVHAADDVQRALVQRLGSRPVALRVQQGGQVLQRGGHQRVIGTYAGGVDAQVQRLPDSFLRLLPPLTARQQGAQVVQRGGHQPVVLPVRFGAQRER